MRCDHGVEVACAHCHRQIVSVQLQPWLRQTLGKGSITLRTDGWRFVVESNGPKAHHKRSGHGASLEWALIAWLAETEREPDDLDEEQAPAEELVEVEE